MVHDYLGTTLDYSEKGVAKLHMKEHFKHSAELKDHTNKASTPAADHLFEANQNCNELGDNTMEEFHTTVANTLFQCKRSARPNLQHALPFLCTGVQSSDEDDWKRQLRLLKYLEQTVEDELTLGADEGDVLLTRCHPDASFAQFAVHADMKSHTGSIQTLGRGAANTIFSKQMLNTKSSTEAELIAADDSVPLALWTRSFLKEPGHESETPIYPNDTTLLPCCKKRMERRVPAREMGTLTSANFSSWIALTRDT